MHRFEWPEEDSVEFHLNHGDMIRLLRANGFEILDLIDLRPREDAPARFSFVTTDWARRWPSEEVWKARKVTLPGAGKRTADANPLGAGRS